MMFDHVALGIELPGPLTPRQRRLWGYFKYRRIIWKSITHHEVGNAGLATLEPDFDDPPTFSWLPTTPVAPRLDV